jgi:hypothetical protein
MLVTPFRGRTANAGPMAEMRALFFVPLSGWNDGWVKKKNGTGATSHRMAHAHENMRSIRSYQIYNYNQMKTFVF